jgi:hypothetical protein
VGDGTGQANGAARETYQVEGTLAQHEPSLAERGRMPAQGERPSEHPRRAAKSPRRGKPAVAQELG